MNMIFERKLAIPMEVKEMYPLTGEMKQTVENRVTEIKNIFSGSDRRLLLIVGPCSADNEDSVIDYILRLRRVQDQVADRILIVPRVYTTKPRTTGEGYKGLLHQPNPEKKPDMFKGIIAMREIHMRVVKETGFASADELLYPENHKYVDDLLAYAAVGARSVENQQHRLTASGMDMPVGMKNPLSGDLTAMMNAIHTARHPHTFIYRGWEAHSQGNPYTHAILRGYTDGGGNMRPNYHYEDLTRLEALFSQRKLSNPAAIVDTNHANSGKNPQEQIRIIRDVLSSMKYNPTLKNFIKGFMIESYIEDGAQKIGDGCYGKSITDPCLGWESTERLILETAQQL